MSDTNVDGLFIAPDGDGFPTIWFEATPGDDFPQHVMTRPYGGPSRHLWDLVANFLPERKVQP